MLEFIVYPLVGVVAGFLAGLLGLGGGIVIVPCLLFIFPMMGIDRSANLHIAIATSMTIVVVTQISALRTHKKYFDSRVVAPLAKLLWPGIIIGSISGAAIANVLSGKSLSLFFGIIVFLLTINVIFFSPKKNNEQSLQYPWKLPHFSVVGLAMFIIGALSALLGLGGGVFLVPFMQNYKVPMVKTVAISAFCGLPLAIIASVTYLILGFHHTRQLAWSTGYVYWPAFMGIAITSMIFAPLGVRLAYRLPSRALRLIFVLFSLFVSVRMIFF